MPDSDPRVWARGKTAEELLATSDQMFQGLVQVAQTQSYTPAPAAPAPSVIGDDDIVDGRTLKSMFGALAQATAQPDPNITQNLASMAYQQVKGMDPTPFKKWEGEILANLNTLDKRMWNVDNIQRVVRMVKADHVDELAQERADHLIAQKGFSARTTGAAAGGQQGSHGDLSLESDELPTDYRERLQKAGVSMETVRSYCAANNQTVKEWFALAKNNKGVMGGAA